MVLPLVKTEAFVPVRETASPVLAQQDLPVGLANTVYLFANVISFTFKTKMCLKIL